MRRCTRYLVVGDFGSADATDPFFEQLGRVLDTYKDQHGKLMVPIGRHQTEVNIRVSYANEAQTIQMVQHDDYLTFVRHLEVTGLESSVTSLCEMCHREIALLDLKKALDADDDTLHNKPTLVAQVAMGAPEKPDERFEKLITRALAHDNAEVRRMAAYASNSLSWPSLLDALEGVYVKEEPGLTKVWMGQALRSAPFQKP